MPGRKDAKEFALAREQVNRLVRALEHHGVKVRTRCIGEYSFPKSAETRMVHLIIDMNSSDSDGLQLLYDALIRVNSYKRPHERHNGSGDWVLQPIRSGDEILFKLHPEENNWGTPLAEYRKQAGQIANIIAKEKSVIERVLENAAKLIIPFSPIKTPP
ncbi:MAG TPA: hypothetical protein VI483_00900 [Candidatus Paceibacterota bacterium]